MEPTDGEVWVVFVLPDLRGVLRGQRTRDEQTMKEEDTRGDTLLGSKDLGSGAEGSGAQSYSQLHTEFKASLGYLSPWLKIKENRKEKQGRAVSSGRQEGLGVVNTLVRMRCP